MIQFFSVTIRTHFGFGTETLKNKKLSQLSHINNEQS